MPTPYTNFLGGPVFWGQVSTLAQQMKGRTALVNTIPYLSLSEGLKFVDNKNAMPIPRTDLAFFNGLGGFTPDGREYVITTTPGQATPAPWVNVLANPQFGTVISETGLAFTWSENAHEYRLTPWANDPVTDSKGEAFYLRDHADGYFWSPTPRPCRGETPYTTRHGFGYSVFEHTERGITSELLVHVAVDAPVKCVRLTVRNVSGRPRKLSATGYVAWVLGDMPEKTRMHIGTEVDQESGAIFANNAYNSEFPGHTAFFDTDETIKFISCDRTEFLGRNGTLEKPAAMKRSRLSGRTGLALDPCAAVQAPFTLAVNEERVITFRLGVGKSREECRDLAKRFKGAEAMQNSLSKVWQQWDRLLGAVHVETPDPSFNVMANGWLMYQTIACRMWGRGATYQSGGAFGFRDQLQDAMALVHTAPHLLREQILLCASQQFPEGDVLHWWHPPSGRGVRTRCSDDYLWLPLAACRYICSTQDVDILNETIGFIEGRPVKEGEDSYYDQPFPSGMTATLYEHCVRAIRHGFKFGAHGLPLIGSGDWNDGMDKVGIHGKGESVWLAFFLYEVLTKFMPFASTRGDMPFAQECAQQLATLKNNIETHGWDGDWYRRAYFDDGTPLGSAENEECRIDSIAQSWSVLSNAGDLDRSQAGMEALNTYLVRREDKLVALFTPPFDMLAHNPGYIKGYVPGVRENGGQYTHAAVWAAMAFAQLGDTKRAWEIFTIINPVNHGRNPEEVSRYQVEPYVVAADVYAAPDFVGRGGWTWYTGSAAWMYRLMLESLLGINVENGTLRIAPCLPADWDSCIVRYRHINTNYSINITQERAGGKKLSIQLDGIEKNDLLVPLVDDLQEHVVSVIVQK
ncbi:MULTISPECIES: GH36-type glycosyl hydrolase domain-containing protein [unclassified Desulfovibrio]|uniref:GH36-type glycosyl hydrolase domain-containing protein n=1 Tax=unclassified Desulfovibrio TaxID=2593640 RepID=UPI002FDAB781